MTTAEISILRELKPTPSVATRRVRALCDHLFLVNPRTENGPIWH